MNINDKEFTQLIDRYNRLVYTVCLNITHDRFDSEDLTQETFLSAYKHRHTLKDDNIKSWLCKIALNKCRDWLRKNKHRTESIDSLEGEIADCTAPSMEETAIRNTEAETLKSIILSLREPYQSAAYHYYIAGIPLSEYGREKNIPVKTLQTQIRRSREMIKQQYEEGWER